MLEFSLNKCYFRVFILKTCSNLSHRYCVIFFLFETCPPYVYLIRSNVRIFVLETCPLTFLNRYNVHVWEIHFISYLYLQCLMFCTTLMNLHIQPLAVQNRGSVTFCIVHFRIVTFCLGNISYM